MSPEATVLAELRSWKIQAGSSFTLLGTLRINSALCRLQHFIVLRQCRQRLDNCVDHHPVDSPARTTEHRFARQGNSYRVAQRYESATMLQKFVLDNRMRHNTTAGVSSLRRAQVSASETSAISGNRLTVTLVFLVVTGDCTRVVYSAIDGCVEDSRI